ncbi:biliverdin-producing heme oxygenase [Lysobacter pythonis]|uniref:Biliverdin-producing heme oxygenase n=1 Tax=Solilutibacter pythonis TaxID=2483112 RepID=A0A3M2HLY6_9GAMM|nr:biliverdin-producing heme oxygenase [Lysobacter pythonis]RMH90736.1 biliverdin-producing heme oxygenase [Lysobacter pythonis]
MTDPMPSPFSKQLKEATRETHDALDQTIMRSEPFASRAHYGRFLRMQYLFHRDIAPLFAHAGLRARVADLTERQRLEALRQDMRDLDIPVPEDTAAVIDADMPLPAALGWFYVAEGSNLGAAILFKQAARLGLGANFGARHLAAHPDGRAPHWRAFTQVLDSEPLDEAARAEATEAARTAFRRVHAHAAHCFA